MEFTVGAALTRWLGDLLLVAGSQRVRPPDETVTIEVAYVNRKDLSRQAVRIRFQMRHQSWLRSPRCNGSPVVDYMARDYDSLLQAMYNQVPSKLPQWKDFTNEADFGNVLLELFAHIGDILSYYQDRVANESFLGTARTPPQRDRALAPDRLQTGDRGAGGRQPDR